VCEPSVLVTVGNETDLLWLSIWLADFPPTQYCTEIRPWSQKLSKVHQWRDDFSCVWKQDKRNWYYMWRVI